MRHSEALAVTVQEGTEDGLTLGGFFCEGRLLGLLEGHWEPTA